MEPRDVIAGIAALVLIGAVVGLSITSRQVPDSLTGALGIAIGWVFRGASNGVGKGKPTS
jgi:hypothetical protein